MAVIFYKYHGLGNDYLFFNLFRDQPPPMHRLPELAVKLSRRQMGAGADGIVIVAPDCDADASMRIFNADGSEAETCGNAIRCVAKMLWDCELIRETKLTIKTPSGIRSVTIVAEGKKFIAAEADMGVPSFSAESIPVAAGLNSRKLEIRLANIVFQACCVSMGNPHCVIFVDELNQEFVRIHGPQIEHHLYFPNRTNVEFCRISGSDQLDIIVWERGSGLTLACGSGACAAFAVASELRQVSHHALVRLPGGELQVRMNENHHILMKGPAEYVYQGISSFE